MNNHGIGHVHSFRQEETTLFSSSVSTLWWLWLRWIHVFDLARALLQMQIEVRGPRP